jgi:Flp pilus assembly protein TadD
MGNRMKMRKLVAITVLVLSSFAASNVAPSKAELEAMYDKAFRQFDSNNFAEALKQLDAIDARQPDLAESQNLRGVILMREGIYDKAEAALHEALRIDPKFWNARFNLAEIPFLKKDWTEARNRFQELLTSNVSELQGDAAQLIQYKILLTYLLEGKENMVDAILAKFELSPDTPAVHYANAAIALQHKNSNEAKDWMTAAEKNFSPQLNKLFAESLYEVGWLEKQSGQTRAALEITSPAEKAAKTKGFARSRMEQAQQAAQQRDFAGALKFIDEADAADPNQPTIINLKGEILMEQKDFDQAEIAFKKAAKIDPKFREAQYNLAQIPFKKKDYAKARDRFEQLFGQTPGGDKNQAAQIIKFKIFMTLLLEGKESRAQKMMEQFQFTGDTPALYYAQAAWEFKHNNATKATDWVASAKKIYSPALNGLFADSFYDLGWLTSPGLAGSPAPANEASAAMAAQSEASPAIEPSPIPGTTVAAKGRESIASALPAPTIAGMEATTSHAVEPSAATIEAPVLALNTNPKTIAAGSPAKPEDIPAAAVPSLSPTVETAVASKASTAPLPTASVTITGGSEAPAAAANKSSTETAAAPESTGPALAAATATPATVLAPSRVRDTTAPSIGERLARFLPDTRTILVWGLILAALGLLAWAFMPAVSRRLASVPLYRRPIPATGPSMDNGNGNGQTSAQKIAPARFFGGPRQVSLQLKASEPNLRRSVRPVAKPAPQRPFALAPVVAPAPMVEAPIHFAPEPIAEVATPASEFSIEAVGPVVEHGDSAEFARAETAQPDREAFQPSVDNFGPAPVAWTAPAVMPWDAPVPTEESTGVSEAHFANSVPVVEEAPVVDEMSPVADETLVRDEAPLGSNEAPVFEEAPVAETASVVEEAPVEETFAVQDAVEPEAVMEEAAVSSPDEEIHEPVVAAGPAWESAAAQPETDPEPIGQGQPVPYEVPAFEEEMSQTAVTSAAPEAMEILPLFPSAFAANDSGVNGIESLRESTEASFFSPPVVSTEPSVLQSTIPETMPEQTQTQNAPVIRTPTGGTTQPASAMHTAVQLTFSFEIASMQLTPSFKMGALQLRPTSKIVTMRLAPSQQPQPAMNLQVNFEISKIQPSGGGLGTVRLSPSAQTRPNVAGSPSFTVAGLQLVSNFESAPVQLTPSQQASVQVTGAFQIATVEFSPSFEIASIVLNSSAKQVAVQLPGAGSLEGAARFDIANLQLGPTGDIGMMQLNLSGGAR